MHARILNDLSGSAGTAFLQSFRTGNIIADMLIAMLLPMAFRALLDGNAKVYVSKILGVLFSFMQRSSSKECIRTITFTQNHRCPQNFESRNELLQKALTLYFTEVAQVEFKSKAQVALTALTDTRWHNERPDRYNPIANYRLTWFAPDGEWIEVDKANKISFRQYTSATPLDNGSNSNSVQQLKEQVCYELRCAARDANARIDALINTAVEWYQQELQSQRDDSRYMYVMNCPERFSFSSTDKDDDAHKYKRYRLSDHKKFDSLFFEEKDALLSVLSDFEEKRGKYGISGFPHKLGVLLHGPPGTGKTSLIKALAQRTQRSIINIPLAQIKTNSMLMDVMYDLKLKVEGVETPRLTFADVIFVIEDVDAASKVVLRRDQEEDDGVSGAEIDALKTALAANAHRSRLAAVSANAPAADDRDTQEGLAGAEGGPAAKKQTSMTDMMEGLFKPRPDELNLAGLLNVLDGVVDTPGRLLIMTSNHPQKLDPALIRPGRIDRLIHLGYLKTGPAAQMLEHCFGTALSDSQRRVLDAALTTTSAEGTSGSTLTPAMLEQLCARYESVDELLASLVTENSSQSAGIDAVGERASKRAAANDSPDAAKMKTGVTAGASSLTTMKEDSDPLSSVELEVKRQTSGG